MNTQTIETPPSILLHSVEPENLPYSAESLQVFIKQNFDEYEVKDTARVSEFLYENQFLMNLLAEIPWQIRQYFGNSPRLKLEILSEHDFHASKELWISILTKLSAEEALPFLDKFDEEWWLENMDRANHKLNITLEFV